MWRALSFILLLISFPSFAAECGNPYTFIKPYIVDIIDEQNGRGTGVILKPNTVLTAGHIFSNIVNKNATRVEGNVKRVPKRHNKIYGLKLGSTRDLAVFHVQTKPLPALRIASSELRPYEKVWAAGIPGPYMLLVSEGRNQGVLHAGYSKQITQDMYYVTTHGAEGMSGGVLLRCEKNGFALAGILSGVGRAIVATPFRIGIPVNINFISFHVTSKEIERFLAKE